MKNLSVFALLTIAVSSAFAAVPAAQLPVADHLVFLNELPESAELMKSAAANGLTITRLDRTSDRVVVTYSYPNGQIATMGYALLSAAGNGDWIAPKPAVVVEKRNVTVVAPEPEVVYVERPYRPRYYYSDPVDNFWLPLTVGVGLGWATSYYGGYYGGGYHGGHHHGGHHHGGGHRGRH